MYFVSLKNYFVRVDPDSFVLVLKNNFFKAYKKADKEKSDLLRILNYSFAILILQKKKLYCKSHISKNNKNVKENSKTKNKNEKKQKLCGYFFP